MNFKFQKRIMQVDKFIIYLHIQKTGGITLQRLLRRKLGRSLLSRAYHLLSTSKKAETLEEALRFKNMEDQYFAGHICFGAHRLLPKPFTYITILREPVSRLVSLYYFSLSNPTSYYHDFAKNKSLEYFLLNTQLMELDNGLSRFLAGDKHDLFINRTPFGECDESLLNSAKQNLDGHFSFVGLLEQYDQSILLLSAIMDWGQCFYLRRNTQQKVKKASLSDELRECIVKRNHLDVKLYEYAKLRFEEDLKKYRLDDLRIVEKFRSQNAVFNHMFTQPYNAYDLLKAMYRGNLGRP